MAAFTGWLVAVSGLHFPGLLSFSESVSFEDLSKLGPLEQWEAVPEFGKVQIISAIFLIEHQSEWKLKPHYMAGGTPGELKGGRLAMLGIVGCLVGGNIPGSIPVPINWPAGPSIVFPFGPLSVYQ